MSLDEKRTYEEQMFLPKKFDCPTLISFSGGRTSAYMLYRIIEAYSGKLPEDVYVVFANTGKEMPETLDFINECSVRWNVPVRWLELDIHEERPIYRTKEVTYQTAARNGEPFAALIDRKKMLPNPYIRMCTSELKVNVMKRFMQNQGHKEWANVIGLRYDEPRRVAKQRKQNDTGKNKWESLMPLYDYKIMVKDVTDFWKNSDFDLELPDFDGKTLAGNCDLCYLKGKRTLVRLLKERPDLADWWIEQETKVKKHRLEKFGAQGNEHIEMTATFRKGVRYVDLVDITSQEDDQLELLEDDSRSCFCHD